MGLKGRPEFGPGSKEPRFNPQFRSSAADKRGPMVRETSQSGSVTPEYKGFRRAIGLPSRFGKE